MKYYYILERMIKKYGDYIESQILIPHLVIRDLIDKSEAEIAMNQEINLSRNLVG